MDNLDLDSLVRIDPAARIDDPEAHGNGKERYGYRVENGETLRDEYEQAVLAAMRDLREQGCSYGLIADILDRHGVRNRGGRPFTHQRIRVHMSRRGFAPGYGSRRRPRTRRPGGKAA